MVADASIIDVDGTFYLYATTDGMGKHLSTAGMPVVWMSKDFETWSFKGSTMPSDFDLKYWAPSAPVQRNGKWFCYPTLDGQITATVAPSPMGPFLAPDGSHVTRAQWKPFSIPQKSSIDAEVFTDDDGQSYMLWSRRRIIKLKPDLLTTDGPVVTIATKRQGYSEGPAFFKRKGIYYYLYTLGGGENYQYAYMMSKVSPMGPWEAPEQDIISTSDKAQGIYGPGHGCFFHPQGSDQWYFAYLEFGRSSTNRQTYVDKMDFNADGTIRPITLTKKGVGAIRPQAKTTPNLALKGKAIASSTMRDYRVPLGDNKDTNRTESYGAEFAIDGSNGSRWMADGKDKTPQWTLDLGAVCTITRTEAYFVRPTAGHAYRLEASVDGQNWLLYGGHDDVIQQSPHTDTKKAQVRYLRLTVTQGIPGLWDFRVY
jgi:hypothetical protein